MTVTIPGPASEIMTIRIRMGGKHSQASMNRWTTRSNAPPRYPQSIPRMVAMTVAIVVAERPTITEVLAP